MKILHRALCMSYMAACLLFFSKERISQFQKQNSSARAMESTLRKLFIAVNYYEN